MASQNRRTLFVDDSSFDHGVVAPKASTEDASGPASVAEVKPLAQRRFPVKPTPEKRRTVPEFFGPPWHLYERRYRVKYGTLFAIITSRGTRSQ